MLHKFLRRLIRLLLRQFYSRICIIGTDRLVQGPVLFVANHPNYLMDSLIVATQVGRPVTFLAKGTLFKNPILASLLSLLNVIPVHRRSDGSAEGEANKETFAAVTRQLMQEAAIALFPEGVSMGERRVYPLKTGAARMAFLACEESNWSKAIQIQPLGITYSDFGLFRSSFTIIVGSVVNVTDWRRQYEDNPRNAVRDLTAHVEVALKQLTVEVQDQAHLELVENISKVYALAQEQNADDFSRMELISKNVEALAPTNPERAETILTRTNLLLDTVRRYGLDFQDSVRPHGSRLALLAFSPAILLGELIFFIPYKLVGRIADCLINHAVERASTKLLLGALIFPLWSLILAFISYLGSENLLFGLLVLAICLISGYFVSFYLHHFRLLLWDLVPGRWSISNRIRQERDLLIAELDSLRIL